ncbi:MAG: carboxypeptidase regulatory-like domain-containing protein [Candidatus Sumerlaeota bacterium]|nr:carboxypeptidase regulatory-like domain-containing protein [Candidatus Sumerlaeota bacterium]
MFSHRRSGAARFRTLALMAALAAAAATVIVFVWIKSFGSAAWLSHSGGSSGAGAVSTSGTAQDASLSGKSPSGAQNGDKSKSKGAGGLAKKDAATTSAAILAGNLKQLKVRVVWKKTGEGVAGTSVTIVQCHSATREIGGAGRTDANGVALVTFPAAWANVHARVRHPLIIPDEKHVDCPPQTEFVLKVDRGASIFGKIIFEDKRPASGALARIVDKDEMETTADEAGAYEIGGLKEGYHQVVASLGAAISDSDGREPQHVKVNEAERCGPHDLILRPGLTLRGFARNRDTGQPIANAEIQRFLGAGIAADSRRAATSGADGAFQLAGLPVGRLSVLAAAKGYVEQITTLQIIGGAKNACDLSLEPGAAILLNVKTQEGAPAPDADVSMEMAHDYTPDRLQKIKTDAHGQARIESVSAANPPRITVIKTGYRMKEESVTPAFVAGSRVAELTVTLQAVKPGAPDEPTSKSEVTIAFQGRVTNAEGAPIAGAKVYWSRLFDLKSEAPALTNEDGNYRLELKRELQGSQSLQSLSANKVLVAFAQGYAPAVNNHPGLGAAPTPREVNLTMEKGHWVGGVVVNAKNEPLVDMEVRLDHSQRAADESYALWRYLDAKSVRTGDDGAFRLEDLPGVKLPAKISGKGWTTQSMKELTLDQETRIVMREAGVIKGRVVEEGAATPVKSYSIKWDSADGRPEREPTESLVNTDDGCFTIYDLQQDMKYAVTVRASGFVPAVKKDILGAAEAQAKPVEFKLSKGVETKGTIFAAADQTPIAGAQVALYPAEGDSRHGYRYRDEAIRTQTDKDGVFSLRESDDPGILIIKANAFGPLLIPAEDRERYGGVHALRIGLRHSGAIKGTVTVKGKPVSGARISHYGANDSLGGDFEEISDRSSDTDEDGFYRIADLVPGSYGLNVDYSPSGETGFSQHVSVSLGEAEEKTVDIKIDSGAGILFGRVLKNGTPSPDIGLTLRSGKSYESPTFAARSNPNGEYRIENLPEGRYTVELYGHNEYRSGRYTEEVEVKGETQHDFILAEKHKLLCRIVFDGIADPSQTPTISGAGLRSPRPSSGEMEKGIDYNTYNSEMQGGQIVFRGRFKGQYFLFPNAELPGGKNIQLRPKEALQLDNLAADQDVGEIHVSLSEGASLKGHVYGAGGRPAKEMRIILEPEKRDDALDSFCSCQTDEEGAYQMYNLKEGVYTAAIYPSNSGDGKLTEKVEIKGATTHDFIFMKEFKLKARLILPEKDTRYRLSNFTNAVISLIGAGAEDPQSQQLQIRSGGETPISNGEMTFIGRFMGQYYLTLSNGDQSKSTQIPRVFTLDNMDHDQDLGEIVLPTMGAVRVRLSFVSASIPRPDHCGVLLLMENPGSGVGAMDEQTGSSVFQLDVDKSEQEIGPLAEGTHRLYFFAAKWKADPAMAVAVVKAGETYGVSLSLAPQGVLGGMVRMPNGSPKHAMPSRITLEGPGGTRSVVPHKATPRDYPTFVGQREYASEDQFVFHDLQEGTWRLTIEAEGCVTYVKDFAVKIGETRDESIEIFLKRR